MRNTDTRVLKTWMKDPEDSRLLAQGTLSMTVLWFMMVRLLSCRFTAGPRITLCADDDVFGNEEGAAIRYKTLSWPLVAVLMIAEIVSNGMLSLPAATAVVGIVPGVILIVFLGEYCQRRQ
jgi:hypothetical protein